MTVQHTDPATAEDRTAAIRARLDAARAPAARDTLRGLGAKQNAELQVHNHAFGDIEHLLSLVEQLQGQLDKVRELHTMERRYTDESYERSYDTSQEAAEALGITPGAAVYLDVCSHCGSIEMDAGADDYRESLWPCPTVEALGLGEEAEDA